MSWIKRGVPHHRKSWCFGIGKLTFRVNFNGLAFLSELRSILTHVITRRLCFQHSEHNTITELHTISTGGERHLTIICIIFTKKIFNLINNGLQKNNKEPFDEYYLHYPTSQFYNSFLLPKFVNEKVLTSFLLDCNIRGIMNNNQYKSLNFTVFDKNDIRILERVF